MSIMLSLYSFYPFGAEVCNANTFFIPDVVNLCLLCFCFCVFFMINLTKLSNNYFWRISIVSLIFSIGFLFLTLLNFTLISVLFLFLCFLLSILILPNYSSQTDIAWSIINHIVFLAWNICHGQGPRYTKKLLGGRIA